MGVSLGFTELPAPFAIDVKGDHPRCPFPITGGDDRLPGYDHTSDAGTMLALRQALGGGMRRFAKMHCAVARSALSSKHLVISGFKWSGRGDSNSRPLAPHASALPGYATARTKWIKEGSATVDGKPLLPSYFLLPLVPGGGVEPPHPLGYKILSLARLPIPPSGRFQRVPMRPKTWKNGKVNVEGY